VKKLTRATPSEQHTSAIPRAAGLDLALGGHEPDRA
jgi:hypothetical protein